MKKQLKKSLPFALILLLNLHLVVQSQVTSPGTPIYKPGSDTIHIPEYTYNLKNYATGLKTQDKLNFKNNDFAISLEVSINPEKDGIWVDFPAKQKKVWLLKIKVEHAISLNLILNPFHLNEGTKLFFYDSLQSRIIGAITYENNKSYNILPLSQIQGNTVFCEMQVPDYISNFGNFTISNIGAEPEKYNSLKSTQDEWFNSSQSCNVNVACFHDENIQNQKNAVCRIIYNGRSRCTGTLINNQEKDGKPYVITAAHCINTDFMAQTAVFYFGFESPVCANIEGPIKSISGSMLVSSGNHVRGKYDTLDFALLLLNEFIPPDYLPYYSGWDATGTTPDSVYVIHHPEGDIKKISIDNDKPLTGSAGFNFDKNTHWVAENYEIGTTEDGSSGSGLIDDKNRLIGILTLGGDPCQTYINDYYQKFSHAYNDYSKFNHQLKHWLDPKATNKLICNGFDAAGVFRNLAGKLSNYNPNSNELPIKQKKGWGYISGHNYQGNALFAERFDINGSKYLYGANINPTVVFTNNTAKKITFNIWEGNESPARIIYSKNIALSDVDEGNQYYIDFDSTILVSKTFFAGYQVFYNTDTFALKTYTSLESENTAYTYINASWKPLQFDNQNQFGHLAIELLTFDLMPEKGIRPDSMDWSEIYIYPNPMDNQLQIYFRKGVTGNVSCKLYELTGKMVFQQTYLNPEPNIFIQPQVAPGIYILSVAINNENAKSFKILVQ